MAPTTIAATTPSTAKRVAPPVNGTMLPPGALVLVAVEGGGSVALVTGVGNGAVADDVSTGVTEAGVGEAGVGEAGVDDGDGATIVLEAVNGVAALEETAEETT